MSPKGSIEETGFGPTSEKKEHLRDFKWQGKAKEKHNMRRGSGAPILHKSVALCKRSMREKHEFRNVCDLSLQTLA